MNTPMTVSLKSGTNMCIRYNIKEVKELQVVLEIPSLEFIEGDVHAKVNINDK